MKNFSELVKEERPDYKACNSGFESLNAVELISLIIGQGTDQTNAIRQARQIMNVCGGSLRDVANRRPEELEVVQGVGVRKALAIKAALELAKRVEHEAAADVTNSTAPTLFGVTSDQPSATPTTRRHTSC